MAEGNFLYLKLYNQVKEDIESGKYQPGEKLPPEAELRRLFGISAITVKKAFGMLAEEGFVRRVPGKGTFVKEDEQTQPAPARSARLIGMILEHVASPYGLDMLYAIDRLLTERGYRLCVRYSYGDRERETSEIEFLLSLGVAGLIIMPCHGNHYSTTILRLIIDDFPVVLIDKRLEGIPVPSVRTDNAGATACLTEHLYERGCRRIGMFSIDPSGASSLAERVEGCRRKLEEFGLPESPSCFVYSARAMTDNRPETPVISRLRTFLREEGAGLDGLICTEFGILPSLVAAAELEGVKLGPDGLRACCVDEDYLAPGGFTFTHVKQDEHTIAAKTVEMLEERLNNGTPMLEDCLVPGLFMQGRTT